MSNKIKRQLRQKSRAFMCGLLALFMLFSSVALLASCRKDQQGSDQEGLPLIGADGSHAFQIIRPDNCSKDVLGAAVSISTAFKTITGKAASLGSDYVSHDGIADYPEMEYEILIGNTNRPESQELAKELGDGQYIIRVMGKKIVIVGKNDFCLTVGVNEFAKKYLTGVTTVSIPTDLNDTGVCDFMYIFDLPRSGNDRYDIAVMAATLQGTYNLTADKKLYLLDGTVPSSKDVLDIMSKDDRWLSHTDRVNLGSDVLRLFEIAKDAIKTVVIWDPHLPCTVNIATTIAGVESGIVMTQAQYNTYEFNLPSNVNVISLVGKFNGSETGSAKNDAYRWAIREYLLTGKCSPDYIFSLEDAFGRNMRNTYARDLAVQKKGFVFDLSPWEDEAPKDDPTQKPGTDLATYMMILEALQELRGTQKLTEVVGFFSGQKYADQGNDDNWTSKYKGTQVEWKYAYLFTPYQCYWNPSTEFAMNMSLHSTYDVETPLEQNRPEEEIELDDSENMVYMLIVMGDYDSVGSLYAKMITNWNNRFRGRIPLAWSFNPNLIDHYPDIIDYFYQTATPNDYFVSNVGGAGWYNPSRVEDTEEQWEMWLDHHLKYFEMTDMSVSPDMWDFQPFSAMAEKYITQYATTGAGTLISNQLRLSNAPNANQPTKQHVAENGSVLDEISNRFDRNDPVKCAEQWKIDILKRDDSREGHATFMSCRCVWSTPEYLIQCLDELQKLFPDKEIKVVDPFTYYRLLGESLENN
jgi:hypothetical protein